jgi:hypothetical protein
MARRGSWWSPSRWWRQQTEHDWNKHTGELVDVSRSGPVPSHNWRECRPVMLQLDTGKGVSPRDPGVMGEISSVAAIVWSRLRDTDKQAFHRVCCLDSRDPDDMAVAEHLSETLRVELARRGL